MRRVVVPQSGMEFHFGQQFPCVGFIVTNLETGSWAFVQFHNRVYTLRRQEFTLG